jgi:hypothetical protein
MGNVIHAEDRAVTTIDFRQNATVRLACLTAGTHCAPLGLPADLHSNLLHLQAGNMLNGMEHVSKVSIRNPKSAPAARCCHLCTVPY